MIAAGATDMQVADQMGHSKVETTKNIYGHLFAQDRAFVLKPINQAVSRPYYSSRRSLCSWALGCLPLVVAGLGAVLVASSPI